MSFKNYSHDEIAEMSMIEIAHEVLTDEKQALDFNELFDKVAGIKGFSDEQKKHWIAQLFTDLNVDGRFLTIGSNMWGLKRWYPVEQAEEEIQAPVKKNKKKAATKAKPKKQEQEQSDIEEEEIEDDLDLDDEELDLDEDGEENSGLDEDFDLSENDDDYSETEANDESLNEVADEDEDDDDEEEEDETL